MPTAHSKEISPELAGGIRRDDTDALNCADEENGVAILEGQIADMKAALKRLEDEIADMQARSNGDAASISEIAHARAQAGNIRKVADAAQSVVTEAKSGKKRISSQRIVALSSVIGGMILGADKEGSTISTVTHEGETRNEVYQAHATEKAGAQPHPVYARCGHAVIGATTQAQAATHHWFGNAMGQLQETSARVTHGLAQGWGMLTASVATFMANPLGQMRQAGGAVMTGIQHAAAAVADGVHAGLHAASDATHQALVGLHEKLHAGKTMLAHAFAQINPFKEKTPGLAHHQPVHSPIAVHGSAMEKAMEQAKAVLGHALPHLSMPNLFELHPSSVPFGQGVSTRIGVVH